MLLLHQIGSVKIGEVVRYTVTYTPAHDRILPAPEQLYLRIRNTSNSALRAAFVHGPYTLYVDAFPAHFDPHKKLEQARQYGVPEFEPMLKAGGTWTCRLLVPESVRRDAGSGGGSDPPTSVSWIINICSQVIFSTSAAVHYEVLLARDPKSLEIVSGGLSVGMPDFLAGIGGGSSSGGGSNGHGNITGGSTSTGSGSGGQSRNGSTSGANSAYNTLGQALQPGRVSDYQRGRDGRHPDQPKGVFSRAIQLRVEDTAALWNKPQLPGWVQHPAAAVRASPKATKKQLLQQQRQQQAQEQQQQAQEQLLEQSSVSPDRARQQARGTIPAPAADDASCGVGGSKNSKRKKMHLVVLTHGLHSNLGGDMLFIKESIDAAVQQAKIDRKARLAKERAERGPAEDGEEEEEQEDGGDDEEVVVRGYSGNATRTERGIKYLGKRLARYVLSMTYPDQPFLPSSKGARDKVSVAQHGGNTSSVGSAAEAGATAADGADKAAHKSSTIHNLPTESQRAYQFTKISFVAHSLGGLVQTYAVAYIQKHSPQFFDMIEPVNFIAMASPFLGLNHENPLYVKFALDFGLVGRTGQDLGLTWRPPTLARSGWGALVSNLSENAHRKVLGDVQPESKPLLRILPTGPAHTALKKFRNRTVYSNVVNDGIVPLRTSCLLFLDWQGLDRVEKARREAGLVETVMGFGWAELVGTNVMSPREEKWTLTDEEGDVGEGGKGGKGGDADGDKAHSSNTPDAEEPESHKVPQPSTNATQEDDRQTLRATAARYSLEAQSPGVDGGEVDASKLSTAQTNNSNPFSNFFNSFFKNDDAPSLSVAPEHTGGGVGGVGGGSAASQPESPTEQHHPKQPPPSSLTPRQTKIYRRSQTLRADSQTSSTPGPRSVSLSKSRVTTGSEFGDETLRAATGESGGVRGGGVAQEDNNNNNNNNNNSAADRGQERRAAVTAPPTTSFFEAATDIINPKLPTMEFLIDPAKRPRTIFHDRIYHPSDIPPPPLKPRPTNNSSLMRRRMSFQPKAKSAADAAAAATAQRPAPVASSSASLASSTWSSMSSAYREPRINHQDSTMSAQDYDDVDNIAHPERRPEDVVDSANIKVEEKIARAYHRGLSWRKVLVKLEPDAHNNMIVRRMFANAFGWPVIKHMVDAHFSDSAAARTRDDIETNTEQAAPLSEGPDATGSESRAQKQEENDKTPVPSIRGANDTTDQASESPGTTRRPEHVKKASGSAALPDRRDSMSWSDRDWNDSADDSDAGGAGSGWGAGAGAGAGGGGDVHLAYGGSGKMASSGTTTGPLSPLKQLLSNTPLGGGGSSSSTSAAEAGDASSGTGPAAWTEKIVGKQPGRTASMSATSTAVDKTEAGGGGDDDVD